MTLRGLLKCLFALRLLAGDPMGHSWVMTHWFLWDLAHMTHVSSVAASGDAAARGGGSVREQHP